MKVRVASGVVEWCLRRSGRWGCCLYPFGVYILQEHWFNRSLIRHEGRHWLQAQRMGAVKFYWLYLWYTLRYGYENNPLEQDAQR